MNRRDALSLIAASAAFGITARPGNSMNATDSQIMQRRKIPSSGEMLPIVGLGTWQTFGVGESAAERKPLGEVLQEFVALGGKLIDSSPMYGSSESVVGDLARQLGLRDKLFVATKVWTSGKRAGIEQMEDSMQKLGADPIDLMQVHNLVDVETQLETLNAWKREGRVRYVGVTHYHAGSHAAVARVMSEHPLDFIQINYSVVEREAEQRLLPLARERGVAVIVNRPFAGGDVLRRIRSRPLPAWAAEMDCNSWAQVLLKFVLSHPAVTCAIPATSRLSHLRDNMQAGSGRMPDEALRKKIVTEAF